MSCKCCFLLHKEPQTCTQAQQPLLEINESDYGPLAGVYGTQRTSESSTDIKHVVGNRDDLREMTGKELRD